MHDFDWVLIGLTTTLIVLIAIVIGQVIRYRREVKRIDEDRPSRSRRVYDWQRRGVL